MYHFEVRIVVAGRVSDVHKAGGFCLFTINTDAEIINLIKQSKRVEVGKIRNSLFGVLLRNESHEKFVSDDFNSIISTRRSKSIDSCWKCFWPIESIREPVRRGSSIVAYRRDRGTYMRRITFHFYQFSDELYFIDQDWIFLNFNSTLLAAAANDLVEKKEKRKTVLS